MKVNEITVEFYVKANDTEIKLAKILMKKDTDLKILSCWTEKMSTADSERIIKDFGNLVSEISKNAADYSAQYMMLNYGLVIPGTEESHVISIFNKIVENVIFVYDDDRQLVRRVTYAHPMTKNDLYNHIIRLLNTQFSGEIEDFGDRIANIFEYE